MQISSPPGSTTRTAASGDVGVQHAVDTYVGSLRSTGGEQMEAHLRGGEGQGMGAALYRAPPFEVQVPALPVARLSVNLTHTQVGAAVGDERMHSFDACRYALFLTPAGVPMTFRKDVPSRHINIYFHPDQFGDDSRSARPLAVSRPVLNLLVPGVREVVNQLVDELQRPAMLSADAAESLARLLLVQVARHLQRRPNAPGDLEPALLARVHDYVVAHLAERILVADMARQVGLSGDRFALAFKAQTGHPPHRFVMSMRLDRATDLLRNSNVSLAEVASLCGFSSQQHLSNVMRQQVGATPLRYRESGRSTPKR